MASEKRKAPDAETDRRAGKKAKIIAGEAESTRPTAAAQPAPPSTVQPPPVTVAQPAADTMAADDGADVALVESEKKKGKRKAADVAAGEPATAAKYRKLAPPRPFPTVPTSVSATGPRSAHVEGKNYICITRKTPLGAYLRRCKDVVLKAGHKTLHLSAMGAAIPHLLQLSLSLPEILPFAPEEIHTEVLTGTVEVQDEVIPEDEDEDISYRTRGKSSLSVVITIGDGKDEGAHTGKGRKKGRVSASNGNANPRQQRFSGGAGGKQQSGGRNAPERVVIRAEDMEE